MTHVGYVAAGYGLTTVVLAAYTARLWARGRARRPERQSTALARPPTEPAVPVPPAPVPEAPDSGTGAR